MILIPASRDQQLAAPMPSRMCSCKPRNALFTHAIEHKPCVSLCAQTGRQDASAPDPVDRMPAETLTAEQLRGAFAAKGISAQELVALSGAHTVLTQLHC